MTINALQEEKVISLVRFLLVLSFSVQGIDSLFYVDWYFLIFFLNINFCYFSDGNEAAYSALEQGRQAAENCSPSKLDDPLMKSSCLHRWPYLQGKKKKKQGKMLSYLLISSFFSFMFHFSWLLAILFYLILILPRNDLTILAL